MRLRIAHLLGTPQGKPGGLETHTLELCEELAKRHEVHLLADAAFARRTPVTVTFHPVDFNRSRWNPLLYVSIARHVRNIAPNVVHAQAGKPAVIWRSLRHFFPGIACVATQHGVQRDINHYLAMDRIITVSATLAERYPKGRTTVIHNGLRLPATLPDAERIALRTRLADGYRGPLLIAVGRLDAIKGFDVLLRAVKGVDAKLLLVGDGNERTTLEAQMCDLGITAQVSFLGWRKDIPALLQAADLCVISSHSEGFPLVMVEALHAGTPLVSTDVSGVREVLPPELLVPINDAAALHVKLTEQLARLPALRAQLAPVFSLARSELTLAGMASRTETVYYEAIAHRQVVGRHRRIR